ncbi:UNVERIFIED_CONTAM: transcriptional regulator [Streptococcus canis]|uniref:Transcriptional regulator n=1 Tax=Streptococcus canis TaxID=1329 RepID=A0A3P5XSX4_STRCB|nr:MULTISPECIES: transcriptional regulator [Streptococcus]MDV5973974.1 transcriptional regulator [Streptococcus canis]MDV5978051.1 transcriptional regulator [Streptococcus canis]MDV6023551.1 transcriptional regulator [Streptococcus canis]QKG78711.1 transcriptional regulator [Streptococcus canis]VDC43896.1 hypothetical protein FMV2238Y02_23650 [Streptococcus canis]
MKKKNNETTSISVRIPKKLYADYKKVLMSEGKIVTYDLRNYMSDVVKNKKGLEK